MKPTMHRLPALTLPLALLATSSVHAAFTPNDPYFPYDPSIGNYPGQWHLENQAPPSLVLPVYEYRATNSGLDINVRPAWNNGFTGKGVVIGIVDDGTQPNHPDIAPNYRADLSRNFSFRNIIDPFPQGPYPGDKNNHGTAVAGLAAARGGNGIGVTGVAPFAQIAAQRVLGFGANTNADFIQSYYEHSGYTGYSVTGDSSQPTVNSGPLVTDPLIPVRNHSYGMSVPYTGYSVPTQDALEDIALAGVVNVFAAGNERGTPTADSNKGSTQTSPFIINVAALSSTGTYASYSSYGSNITVTAPSGSYDPNEGYGMMTTDRTGIDGYNPINRLIIKDDSIAFGYRNLFPDRNYTPYFDGTSAAAPVVTGVMALGKEANPGMDVRMARYFLAKTAVPVDLTDKSKSSDVSLLTDGSRVGWQTTGAPTGFKADGSDLQFNPNYGFGLVDAGAFVREIQKGGYATPPVEQDVNVIVAPTALPNGGRVARAVNVAPASTDPIEGVGVYVDIDPDAAGADRGTLRGILTSPSGTQSVFMYQVLAEGDFSPMMGGDPLPGNDLEWFFFSNAFFGEDATGTWYLNIVDTSTGNTVPYTINDVDLAFFYGDIVSWQAGLNQISTNINPNFLSASYAPATVSIPNGITANIGQHTYLSRGTLRIGGVLDSQGTAFAPGPVPAVINAGVGASLTQSGGELLLLDTGRITLGRNYRRTGGTLSAGWNGGARMEVGGNFTQTAGKTTLRGVDLDIVGDLNLDGGSFSYDNASTIAIGRDLRTSIGFDLPNGQNLTPGRNIHHAGGTINVGGASAVNPPGNYLLTGGTLYNAGNVNPGGSFRMGGGLLTGPGNINPGTNNFLMYGGTINPGGSVGNTNIIGNFNMSGGTLYAETNASGTDTLTIVGTANLGGTLAMRVLDNTVISPTDAPRTILTALPVNGAFNNLDTIVRPTLFFYPVYYPNSVRVLVREDFANDLIMPLLTPSGRNVAGMLNQMRGTFTADQRNVIDALNTAVQLPDAASRIEQLAPKNLSEQQAFSVQSATMQSNLLAGRTRLLRQSSPTMSYTAYEWQTRRMIFGGQQDLKLLADTSDFVSLAYRNDPFDPYRYAPSRFSVWTSGTGTLGERKTDGASLGYDFDALSAAAGFDYLVTENLAAGLMTGYSHSNTTADDPGSSEGEADSMLVGVYATFTIGGFYWDTLIGYGMNSYELTRKIVFPGVNRAAKASPDGHYLLALINGGYQYTAGDWSFGPTYGIQYLDNTVEAYTETGAGGLNLRVGESGVNSLRTSLGFEISRTYWTLPAVYIPELRAGWVHEFKNGSQSIPARFATPNGVPFNSYTNDPDTDFATIGTGITILLDNDINLSFNYDFSVSPNYYEHNLNSKVSYSF